MASDEWREEFAGHRRVLVSGELRFVVVGCQGHAVLGIAELIVLDTWLRVGVTKSRIQTRKDACGYR